MSKTKALPNKIHEIEITDCRNTVDILNKTVHNLTVKLNEKAKLAETLSIERDHAEILMREAIIRADMPKPQVHDNSRLYASIAIKLCIAAVVVAGAFVGASLRLDYAQNVQWKYVEGHTVYIEKADPAWITLVQRASAALENGHRTKADMLMHDAVVKMQGGEQE